MARNLCYLLAELPYEGWGLDSADLSGWLRDYLLEGIRRGGGVAGAPPSSCADATPGYNIEVIQHACHIRGVSWEVEYTCEWWDGLDAEDQIHIDMDKGPSLGRPFADTVIGSRFPNMKELRPRSGNIRILFAFDPRRTAILLGDKTGRWQEWYQQMIPVADRLFEEHLKELEHDA